MSIIWTCLSSTPFNQKNPLFARFFKTQEDIEDIARQVSLAFAPGLLDVLKEAAPPVLQFFKSLPLGPNLCWGIYAIVMEKPKSRPRLYVGSATSIGTPTACGSQLRLKQYDTGFLLPQYVQASLAEGYVITHKGLLCWIIRPGPALQPIARLLFILLEATFAYVFWAMRARLGDYGMGHICLWDRTELEYDGLCSHCALNEGVLGQFDMSAEELEEYAKEREAKRRLLKSQNNSSWHYKRMADDYDNYIGQAHERVKRSRANNPERDKMYQAEQVAIALAENKFYCEICDIAVGTSQSLREHKRTAKHLRKVKEQHKPPAFFCKPCNLSYHNKSNLTRHELTKTHADNLKDFVKGQGQ
jgi:hypothetical protein